MKHLYLIYSRFLTLLLATLLQSIAFCSFAQSRSTISLDFIKAEIPAKSGSTSLAVLRVINNAGTKDSKAVTLFPTFSASEECHILSKPLESYSLKPEDTLLIPIRVLIPKNAKGGQLFLLKVFAAAEGYKDTVFEATCLIKTEVYNLVFASMDVNTIYLKPSDPTSLLKVRISNQGNTDQLIKLKLDYPSQLTVNASSLTYFIKSGNDTVITIPLSKGQAFDSDGSYTILLYVFNNEERIINSFLIKVGVLASIKRYVPVREGNYLPHHLELRANGLFTDFNYYNLSGWGNIALSKTDNLSYRYRTYYFGDTRSLFLRNAYVAWRNPTTAITVGDQSDYFEKSIFGRGIRFEKKTDQHNVQATYLRNAYRSFSNNYANEQVKNAEVVNSVMLKHGFDASRELQTNAVLVQQWDEVVQTNSSLIAGEAIYHPSTNQHLKVLLGASTENHYKNIKPDTYKQGGVANIEYIGGLGQFTVKSNNYLGSKTYAGTLRGTTQLAEQLSYKVDEARTIGIEFKNTNTAPELYFKGEKVPFRTLENTSVELQYGFKNFRTSLNLRPMFVRQSINDRFISSGGVSQLASSSPRLIADWQTQWNGDHSLAFNTDIGNVFPDKQETGSYFTAQLRTRYTYRNYGVNSLINIGPYYIFEQLNYLNSRQYGSNLSFAPFAGINFWRGKGRAMIIGNIGYDGIYNTRRTGVTGDIQVSLPFNFKANSQLDYVTIRGYHRTELKVGIEKDFGKIILNTHQLKITFFHDINANRMRDPNEEGIPDIMVSINHSNLITDSMGTMLFKKLPVGEYKIYILDAGSYYAFHNEVTRKMILTKDEELAIPLLKDAVLRGKIDVRKDKFTLFADLNLSGIRVTAMDTTGNQFYTLTNDRGEFTLFLPANQYKITLNKAPLGNDFEFEDAEQIQTVEKEKLNKIVFKIREKRRSVTVKKFDSNGKLISISGKKKTYTDTLYLIHTVEAGNTIYYISKKYNMNMGELMYINDLYDDRIYIGQDLKVYKLYNAKTDLEDYTVESTNSILSIARKFNMTEEELLRLNNLRSYTIKRGQVLKVFKRQ